MAGESSDPYTHRLNCQRVSDGLYVLAHSFDPHHAQDLELSAIKAFIRAYISQGTITRGATSPRSQDEDIYTDDFHAMNLASNRRATEPRDYVFATMPQFPWYHYPADAEQLSFNAIFQDFCQQSTRTDHLFAYRITRSMTNPAECSNPEVAWLPSNEQPEPKCLGDFLKLLGQKILSDSGTGVIHLCSVVQVEPLPASPDFLQTMATVESAMNFSTRIWGESHRGGELSRYGCWPEDAEREERFLKTAIEIWQGPNPDSKYSPEEIAARLTAIENELDDKRRARLEDPWLQKQAMRILDLKWCAVDPMHVSRPHKQDWRSWSFDLPKQWSIALQQTMLLHAAMVSCQVPLSAAEWAGERFLPVLVNFETQTVLGLLAKHAYPDALISDSKVSMLCVGRHPAESPLGKDLVLVDVTTKMPVGLVPDFLDFIRTDEEFVGRVTELYHTLNPIVTSKRAMFRLVSLNAISVDKCLV